MRTKASQPVTLLVVATVLFALGPTILKLLTDKGGQFGFDNPGVISFCNVLFVGNFCAALVTRLVYRSSPMMRELVRLPRATKGALLVSALLSTIYPALIFTAIERTSVINVVLVSRFNGIVFVVLAYLFYRARVRRSEIVGYAVIAIGVLALVAINNHGFRLMTGELLVLISTVFFALTEITSKTVLRKCSIPTYVFVRNLVSSLIFFVVAIYLFGPDHFAEAFSGDLWLLMFVYAGITVVVAQLAWLRATRVVSPKTVASVQLLNPAFTITFAFILLNEVPSALEWSVMAIVVVGMLIPKLFDWNHVRHENKATMFGSGLAGIH